MDIRVRSFADQTVEADVLFMSIGEGAIVTDSSARISRINQKALDILGYNEDELLGKWFPEAICAEDESGREIPNIERPMAEVFITGEAVSRRAYYRRKDGTQIPVFLTVSPVMIDGKPIGAIELFRDITDEIALENAKDEFVAIASHQLRTPATAVKQYVGLLLEGYAEPLTENQKMFLDRAYENNERQLQIVQEILKVTQLDLEKVTLKLKRTDLRTIAEESAKGLRSNFEKKKQKLEIILPKTPVWANVDKAQIKTAVENLLENSSNYTWPGKTISLSVESTPRENRISVKDEGVGIAKMDIPKLFKKFSRIPNDLSIEIGGTGLGLYWAARIVELHGGTIKVKSRPGRGSLFSIVLPR
jgi:two-component system phosphate regulon sensor histidine kinase PhoR